MKIMKIHSLNDKVENFNVHSIAKSDDSLAKQTIEEHSAVDSPVSAADCEETCLLVKDMDCPVEVGLIERALEKLPVVLHVECNILNCKVNIIHKTGMQQQVISAINELGMSTELTQPDDPLAHHEPEHHHEHGDTVEVKWLPLTIAGLLALTAELLHLFDFPFWAVAITAVVSIVLCGLDTYKNGLLAIRHGTLNINALMSVAVTGAIVIGQWPEAAMVMFLFTISELLESFSLVKARRAVQGLVSLMPEVATVKQPDGDWAEVNIKQVIVGDVIRVRPGEKIPIDGEVISGYSTVNQAAITGESMPIDKQVRDKVYGGTLNLEGSFEYRVTTTEKETTLARIIQVVEKAQSSKAPIQRFIDKFAQIYTPTVFVIALLVAIIPPLFFSAPWLEWIYKGLVLLVISCPCALVISTPVTLVCSLAVAARKGILVKGGEYIEKGRKLHWLALDKTGTLTKGKPVQTDVLVIAEQEQDNIKKLAASLAACSDHPVSYAIATAAKPIYSQLDEPKLFTALPGRGIQGLINDKTYYLGNMSLMQEKSIDYTQAVFQYDQWEQQGKTVIMFADEQQVLAIYAVADTLRPESKETIIQLQQMGINTVMLTGDNESVAELIAKEVGINRIHSKLLPIDKLTVIQSYRQQNEIIGMVGDGINDAPALAEADIGFAMAGEGTDTAIETADVALMNDDLGKLLIFFKLSRKTYRLLVQNITLAIGIKLLFLLLTIFGFGTMWMAVFADVGTTLLVVMNGMRLLRWRD